MRYLAGRVAVVTGAASGIGLAISRRLGADGMRVMMADIDEAALVAAAAGLRADGIEAATTVADVSDAASVDDLGRSTLDRFGAVHVVCNNAGVSRGGPAWQLPLPTWEWIVGVNLFGIVHGIRTFVPHLIAQQEGHIVNTASLAGLIAAPWTSPYNATKHAAVAVSESLYHELAAIGSPVGVTVVCPGMVRTQIYDAYRHWPARYGSRPVEQDPPGIAEWRRAARAAVEAGREPAAIAATVRDAIVSNRFWVLTHAEFGDAVLSRYNGAVAGRNPGPAAPS
ncbi:MAG TPA: SDR family NAD(P)-dependent oxidoreductase [Streptosporangiaceae bacterium]|jgi:NADP-dependent 3-hydroxy acid dehydrogenase YdfG